MSITPQMRAEILRLFFADHFTMNAIAAALGIHHDTVKRRVGSRSAIPDD